MCVCGLCVCISHITSIYSYMLFIFQVYSYMLFIFLYNRPAAEGPLDIESGSWCQGQNYVTLPPYDQDISTFTIYIRTFAERAFVFQAEAKVWCVAVSNRYKYNSTGQVFC